MSPAVAEPPVLHDPPGALQPTATFREAARVAMWPQVERLLAAEPGLRDPEATEGLKRYRVATRRLRAALRVFGDALPRRATRQIQPELAELARAVGRVRDLDVRIAGLAAWAAEDARDVRPLLEAWAAERAAAAAEMEHRLDGKRHARLLEELVRLVDTGGDERPDRGRAVQDRVASAAWAGFERLRAAARVLDAADLEALHDLRIRAKRLRYTLEFLGPVLGPEREWLVARLVGLQDHLGSLHDADLASGAARAFLDGHAADLGEAQRSAIAEYEAAQREVVERLRVAVPGLTRPMLAAEFARRLGRAVLGPAHAEDARTPR